MTISVEIVAVRSALAVALRKNSELTLLGIETVPPGEIGLKHDLALAARRSAAAQSPAQRSRAPTDGTGRAGLRSRLAVVHRESKTFAHLSAAKSWARHREVTLESPLFHPPGANTRVQFRSRSTAVRGHERSDRIAAAVRFAALLAVKKG
jgi:hypothetical protein